MIAWLRESSNRIWLNPSMSICATSRCVLRALTRANLYTKDHELGCSRQAFVSEGLK